MEKSQLQAEKSGDLSKIKRIISLLCLQADNSISSTSAILKISEESVRSWEKSYLLHRVKGLNSKKSPGRPSKFTKNQRKELAKIIEGGQLKAG